MIPHVRLQRPLGPAPPTKPVTQPAATPAASFADLLGRKLGEATEVTFSAHAAQRLRDRQITLSDADKARLGRAVDHAAAKGARESLIVMDELAFVVGVPNRTVITVVSPNEVEDTVFTHIDSAVLVGTTTP